MRKPRLVPMAPGGAIALFALLGACAGAPRPSAPPPRVQPVLSSAFVFRAVGGDAELELDDLAALRDPASLLRRSYIHLERGRPQEAIDTCAIVLFGVEQPSPTAESFARYVRGLAFAKLGQPERGEYDLARARELALDPWLVGRLDEAGGVPADAAGDGAAAAELAALQRRSAWRPAPVVAARLDPMGRIYRVTIHHSAMYLRDSSPNASAGQIRRIQHEHMQGRGYGDIGYHYLIDPAGRVWEGRDLRWQGAHARGNNNVGNVGICLLGNFVRGSEGQRPTSQQVTSLQQLTRALLARHGIAPEQIHNHSDFVSTECPGPYVVPIVARLVNQLSTGRVAE